MKIVINVCYGGFSLSPKAVKRLAELQGKPCFFFTSEYVNHKSVYKPIEMENIHGLFFSAFTVPNPNEVLAENKEWHDMTDEEKKQSNKKHEDIALTNRPDDRTDLNLIEVVEELGDEADGDCAELKVIEIPDGTEWEIDEYDGTETVDEKHRPWG